MILKQLFCNHEYELKSYLSATFEFNKGDRCQVPILLLECKKCKKRKVIRDSSCFYSSQLLKKLSLWKKHQYEMYD